MKKKSSLTKWADLNCIEITAKCSCRDPLCKQPSEMGKRVAIVFAVRMVFPQTDTRFCHAENNNWAEIRLNVLRVPGSLDEVLTDRWRDIVFSSFFCALSREEKNVLIALGFLRSLLLVKCVFLCQQTAFVAMKTVQIWRKHNCDKIMKRTFSRWKAEEATRTATKKMDWVNMNWSIYDEISANLPNGYDAELHHRALSRGVFFRSHCLFFVRRFLLEIIEG